MEVLSNKVLICIIYTFLCLVRVNGQGNSTRLFPAIIVFGDSAVDVGNNDYLLTIFKVNFPPYGRDFASKKATGRFCNGELVTDIIANDFGMKYAPAYLSPEASGDNLLNGANFASAGSGYDDKTALTSGAISLPAQVGYFKAYQRKLVKVAGSTRAATIINQSLYLSCFGSSDFLQNYYINPLLNNVYTPAQYSDYLIRIFSKYIKDLYSLGARKIGVTSLPPLGCLPAVKTLFGGHKIGCVAKINNDTRAFNIKVNKAANDIKKRFPELKLVIFDIYTPIYNFTKYPSRDDFTETDKGCCRTGTIETTTLLCNPLSLGTCSNATEYVFWDSVHPSEATNIKLARFLIAQGLDLLG